MHEAFSIMKYSGPILGLSHGIILGRLEWVKSSRGSGEDMTGEQDGSFDTYNNNSSTRVPIRKNQLRRTDVSRWVNDR